ncbi:PemK-like protein (plasmid) [Desulfosporosinus acidiphilus SJ4]|uniref:PemK-like protein n=1 Tax=Desulfosporosinus acidiphilus (strain DSM 22704 / JCM 16185 / SJ4) TaxID=646529 RepID=I4DCQ8_DESAJ|nr:type II toxin-antitoxin system PemK/MazF family toxin [Desulfosporosinus acidiphilus]AFM43582.1 PemK-like protein [Desulfosporosinus acidiphilus SJ4]
MQGVDNLTVRICSGNQQKKNVTSTNQKVTIELTKLMALLDQHLKAAELEKTCNWILEENLWLENEHNQLQGFYNYSRGDIIRTLDYGTVNIGTEIRYPHPFVVLYDNKEDWVIGAPITQASFDSNGDVVVHEPFEIYVPKQFRRSKNPKEFFFTKDSVIQVDQIRRVSKYRAVKKVSFKLRTDLLNRIDNILLENVLPHKFRLFNKLDQLTQDQAKKIAELEEKNLSLQNDMYKMTEELAILKEKLEKSSAKLA